MNTATLITGGSSGIGLGVAESIVAGGGAVAVLGRDADRVEAAVLRLTGDGTRVRGVTADVGDFGQLAAALADIEATLGPVGQLVTCAGRLARGSIDDLDVGEFRAAFDTNVLGTWLAIRTVLPGMLARGYGRIVTIGSVLGTVGAAERGAYAATKGAVHALTRSLAMETAGRGVTVNCVAPGPVRTAMNAAEAEVDAAAQAAFTASIPVGRWGAPADIGAVVAALLRNGTDYLTGAVLHVDGGYTAR